MYSLGLYTQGIKLNFILWLYLLFISRNSAEALFFMNERCMF